MEIKVLILDDELNACEYLDTIIKKNIPAIAETFATTDQGEAQLFINRQKPQLVFLDVEMPKQSGFEFLLSQKEKNFDVIFTTAFSKYAIQAIRFSAIDFLLKPVQPDELAAAFDRFLNQPKETERRQKLYEQFFDNLNSKHEKDFKLTLSRGNRMYFIPPVDIYYCKADDNYTKLFLRDSSEFIITKTLKEVEEMLHAHHFIRTHKSFLINKQHVLHLNNDGNVLLKNQVTVEVSRRRMEEIKKALQR